MMRFLDLRRSPILRSFNTLILRSSPPPRGKARKPVAKRNFDYGQDERLYGKFFGDSSSADSSIWRALEPLRNRAIALEHKNPYVVSAISEIVSSVVGDGIRLQSKAQNIRGGGKNERVAAEIEAAFSEWCRADYSDVTGVESFHQQQATALYNAVLSGEVFARKIYQSFGGSPVPFALEHLESHQLEISYSSGQKIPSGHQIRMGVQVDQWKRPVAYWFRQYHPGDYQFTFRDYPRSDGYGLEQVPADEIIHLYKRIRIGQTRGISWLYPVLLRLRDADDWLSWTLIDKKVRAAVSGILTEHEPTEYEGEPDEEGRLQEVMDLEPGTIKRLQAGETFTGFDPKGSDTGVDEYVHVMLRSVAAGLGIPVEPMARDYSKSNYSSSRLSAIQSQKVYKALRSWFVQRFCQPIFESFLDQAVLSGRLNLPGYEIYRGSFIKAAWAGPAFHHVDPDKESRAQERKLNMGVTTLTRELAGEGIELDDYCRELETETRKLQETARRLGLPENYFIRPPGGSISEQPAEEQPIEDARSLELIYQESNGKY